jgi:hypothetical protein
MTFPDNGQAPENLLLSLHVHFSVLKHHNTGQGRETGNRKTSASQETYESLKECLCRDEGHLKDIIIVVSTDVKILSVHDTQQEATHKDIMAT